MSFSQATILSTNIIPDGAELLVSWTSSSPAGTIYQLYVNGILAWHGTALSTIVPTPPANIPASFNVGTVGASEGLVNFSADLPPPVGTGNEVQLVWQGGTYLATDLAGFHVYQSDVAGGAIDYTTPVGTIAAYVASVVTAGFGVGGFGAGGFGAAASTYTWTSGLLTNGLWAFGVRSFDQAGNEGPAATTMATILGPPNPPARDAFGKRLEYTFNGATFIVTLTWLASPM